MTKVLVRSRLKITRYITTRRIITVMSSTLAATTLIASAPAAAISSDCPQTTTALYQRIRTVPLDPQRVYRVRDASIDRPDLHIDLDDGTIAFTEDICGRITGAAFEGEGEIRLRPPNHEERGSLSLFTGMAILEEQITSAYLRFNDDTAYALQPSLSRLPENSSFMQRWGGIGLALAEFDTLRLLLDFSHFLPLQTGVDLQHNDPQYKQENVQQEKDPQKKFHSLLHAHLHGKKLGDFEVFWDAAISEPLSAGQPRLKDGILFFDSWTSFAPPSYRELMPSQFSDASITNFRIQASVQPPTTLRASTDMDIKIHGGGERTLLFELSRYLKVEAIDALNFAVRDPHAANEADESENHDANNHDNSTDTANAQAHPIDFIQNPAIEGSQLARKGNDLVAVVFPAPLQPGEQLKLRFRYAGEVLSEAGPGLLYVGERGTWYPNLGLRPAQFDMEFRYPAAWTLLATGKRISSPDDDGDGDEAAINREPPAEKISHWTSERPIPVAGFNLGKYVHAEKKVGNILVEAYGTKGVEKSFPKPRPQIIPEPDVPTLTHPRLRTIAPPVFTPWPPSPARDAQAVADKAAHAIENFSSWFGPYPYDSLALTQMPGNLSQGWPELVFLSTFAFLSPQEQDDLHLDPVTRDLASQVLVHETAHQWWGDLVLWNSYRDQWIVEGLANYSSLLLLEQQSPAKFHEVLEHYRRDLLSKNKDGEPLRDAGPVTLGQRLESSHFPDGYDQISYERGTWLFHMLRCMLRDSSQQSFATIRADKAHTRSGPNANAEEPFFRTLRKIRDRYAGKTLSTQQLIQAFEEELPRPLWYERRPKLDWFLEGWIEGTAVPALEVGEIRIAEKPSSTVVTGVIVQKDAPDDLVTAVPIYASTSANTLVFLGEVLADGPETPFRLAAPARVRKILLDPDQTILTAPQ